jgi:hypothetical protein
MEDGSTVRAVGLAGRGDERQVPNFDCRDNSVGVIFCRAIPFNRGEHG